MALVNAHTGESVIEGTDHHIIFTAEAFVQAETLLGMSTPEIISRVQNRQVGFRELQALLQAGMAGYASRQPLAPKGTPNPTKALKILEKNGWLKVSDAIGEAILYSTALGILADEDRKDPDDDDDDDDDDGSRLDPGTGPA